MCLSLFDEVSFTGTTFMYNKLVAVEMKSTCMIDLQNG